MCTRAVYLGKDQQTITGRSMDWYEDMESYLYLFPRGMKKNGGKNKNQLEWVSKYGSVVASVYEGGTADGMNEKGLVANLLFLVESGYPTDDGTKPVVYVSAWTQYVLDHYATVSEAVEDLKKEKFNVKAAVTPNGILGTVHLSLSDPSGDSAILEYIDGNLVVHHGKQYQVMTNSPIYSEQLVIAKYWQEIGSDSLLPGTNRATDRYVRASHYINAARQTGDADEAVATVVSVLRNTSVPRGLVKKDAPNIASTIWRAYADQKNKRYFYEDTARPSIVWVDLERLDFAEGKVKNVCLGDKEVVLGDVSELFSETKAFEFIAE